jgi:hypothetical protein
MQSALYLALPKRQAFEKVRRLIGSEKYSLKNEVFRYSS